MSPARRKQQSTPRRHDTPPAHALGYAGRVLALLDQMGLEPLLRDERRAYARQLFIAVHQRDGYCDTTQAELARRAGVSLLTAKRTEAALSRAGVVNAARWWQDQDRHPLKPDHTRRPQGHDDRHRRKLWINPRLHSLAVQQSLGPLERRRRLATLHLQILAHLTTAAAPNPGPLAPLLTGTRGRFPPLSATRLARSTWQRAAGRNPPGTISTAIHPHEPRARHGESQNPPTAKVSNGIPGTSPYGRDKNLLREETAESPSAKAPGPPALKSPAPAERTTAPDPSPSTPSTGVLRFAPARGDGDGIPATNSPASGGRGEGHSAHPTPDQAALTADPFEELRRRAALTARWAGPESAGRREDIHRLAALRGRRLDLDHLPRLILAPITAALGCTDEDAADLARRDIEHRRRTDHLPPRAPAPVPRTVLTDAAGREWILDWQPAAAAE